MKFDRSEERMRRIRVAPHWGAWIEIGSHDIGGFISTSHPTGVRGLKCLRVRLAVAWFWSHPTGVRGLKYVAAREADITHAVAPHWGAWIEICSIVSARYGARVAPHWGAWIEMFQG